MPPSLPVATRKPDRPQFATLEEAVITSVEWFVEPCWKGERLLARLENGHVRLTDQVGKPAGTELDEAAHVLEEAIDAEQAVIDGMIAVEGAAEIIDELLVGIGENQRAALGDRGDDLLGEPGLAGEPDMGLPFELRGPIARRHQDGDFGQPW